MNVNKVEVWVLISGVAGAVALTVRVQHNGFFWDNILLASRYGQYFFDTNLTTVFVPGEVAVGYPTLFGYGLAWWWKLTHKTLEASHWLMLIPLWGIVWEVVQLVRRFVPTTQIGVGGGIGIA